jgi:hypothetical protein
MSLVHTIQPYRVSDRLTSQTEESSVARYRLPEPGDAPREELIARKLGVNGWGRWHYFRRFYSGSWGDRDQKPLSPRSQDSLFRALTIIEFPAGTKPSLFLTDEGHFELVWRDAEAKAIQLAFGPNDFELYLESEGIDETFPNHRMAEVLTRHFGAR